MVYLTASPLYKYLPVTTGRIPNPILVENITCMSALNHNELLRRASALNAVNVLENGCGFFSLITCDVSHPVWNVRRTNDMVPMMIIDRLNVLLLYVLWIMFNMSVK